MNRINLGEFPPEKTITDRQPASRADALHIYRELYTMDGVPPGMDLSERRCIIEWQEVPPIGGRINLHRISDALAVRYTQMESFDAVVRFLTELYDQGERYGQGDAMEAAANTLAMMHLRDRFQGHPLDDGSCTLPNIAARHDATEWTIRAIVARVRGTSSDRLPAIRDGPGDYYASLSGRSATGWHGLLMEKAREMGPEVEALMEEVIAQWDDPRL